MKLDRIHTNTTWSDASASINSNFAKILQALGGSIPEGVDSTLIRTLYTVDESVGETLTEEQREYNAETYRMLADGLTPMVVYEGCVGAVVGISMGAEDGFAHIFVKIDTGPYLAGGTVLLRKDGSVELREEHFAYKLAVLTEPEAAQLFFENYEVFTELKGVIKGMDDSGVIYSEVDLVGYKGELPYVEYNLHDKRFRVEFNADYTMKEAVDITPEGGGGSADGIPVRTLYYADDEGETLTEEQMAYNAETFTMLSQGREPMVVLDGAPLVLGIIENDFALFTLRSEVLGLIVRGDIILNSDGTVEIPEDGIGAVPPLAFLDNPFSGSMYWMYREIIPEAKGAFLVDGVVYEVDSWSKEKDIPQVEYNEGSKRYRVFFDPDKAYTITDKIDITPAGGGGSIDPELLEGYLPMMREFSDDFNNDFTR